MRAGYEAGKRLFDVAFAVTVVAVTSPLWLAVALSIKLEDRGPVLYRAPRVGRGGDPFLMYKFRTMVVNADRIGGPSTPEDDPRLTRCGHWIRRWKLDELPQLLNVVRGDMSLVGPRPQVSSDVARYSAAERRLLSVRPGVTDWASIRFRDEGAILAGHPDPDLAYDLLIREEKIALGLRYVDERSFRTDLRILGQTLRTLRPGADANGS